MPAAATRADSLRLTLASVEILSLSAVGTIPGVIVLAAAGRNGQGDGMLRSTGDGTLLSWRAPGSATYGLKVDCSSDGTYLLEDGDDHDCWLRVQVYASYLSSTPATARVDLQDRLQNGISSDDVTAAEATAGDVETYTVTLENDAATNLSGLKVWITDPDANTLEISDDNATWVSPTTEETALALPDLAAGATDTLYCRRTVAAAEPSSPSVLQLLHFAFNAL